MELTKEQVAALFDANEIVGGSAKVHVSGAGGGQGLGGTKNEIRYTSAGTSGTEEELLKVNEATSIGQIGGGRRSSRRSRRCRYRKTQKGGKRQPRLNVRISARIRLSRRSRQ